MSELKLKKCPFCGKPGMLHRTMLGWQIYCAGFCGCQLEANDHDRRVVINKWNTRSNTNEAGEQRLTKQSTPIFCPDCKSGQVNYKCGNCDYTFTKW